jgi:hypothetical protein
LAVAPFGDRDFEERVFRRVANALDDGRASGAVSERESLAQLLQLCIIQQERRLY